MSWHSEAVDTGTVDDVEPVGETETVEEPQEETVEEVDAVDAIEGIADIDDPTPEEDESGLETMTREEVKKIAESMGLVTKSTKARKDTLINMIEDANADAPFADPRPAAAPGRGMYIGDKVRRLSDGEIVTVRLSHGRGIVSLSEGGKLRPGEYELVE